MFGHFTTLCMKGSINFNFNILYLRHCSQTIFEIFWFRKTYAGYFWRFIVLRFPDLQFCLRWLAGYLGLAVVFVWCSAQQGKFGFYFSGVFFRYWRGFRFGGGWGEGGGVGHWAIIIWGLDSFLIFPSFLGS